jgi:hypothetical protein
MSEDQKPYLESTLREIYHHRDGGGVLNSPLHLFARQGPGLESPGGAPLVYVWGVETAEGLVQLGQVTFQDGPIADGVPNGGSNEVLLAIVLDRLQAFQAGKFPCVENEQAIGAVQVALRALTSRTAERTHRGVEGKLVP